jgi:nicotinamidase/pyrazinamidase
LILIDIQNDFVNGGSLAVPDGNAVVPVANTLMDYVDLIVATQDWHPADHGSFVSQHPALAVGDVVNLNGIEQILWPDHCVKNTRGAAFVDGLATERIAHVVHKGTDRQLDSYSGFFDNGHKRATGLEEFLKGGNVTRLILVGLATDYCVKFTAMDAKSLGFDVTLATDGVRGVNLRQGDCDQAIKEMRNIGVVTATSEQLMTSSG